MLALTVTGDDVAAGVGRQAALTPTATNIPTRETRQQNKNHTTERRDANQIRGRDRESAIRSGDTETPSAA